MLESGKSRRVDQHLAARRRTPMLRSSQPEQGQGLAQRSHQYLYIENLEYIYILNMKRNAYTYKCVYITKFPCCLIQCTCSVQQAVPMNDMKGGVGTGQHQH